MKKSPDTTLMVLKDIRSEIGALRTEMHDELGALRTEMHGELGSLRQELSAAIVEAQIRTATAITDLQGTMQDMTAVLRAQHDLRPRLERCEREIEELKRRPPRAS